MKNYARREGPGVVDFRDNTDSRKSTPLADRFSTEHATCIVCGLPLRPPHNAAESLCGQCLAYHRAGQALDEAAQLLREARRNG